MLHACMYASMAIRISTSLVNFVSQRVHSVVRSSLRVRDWLHSHRSTNDRHLVSEDIQAPCCARTLSISRNVKFVAAMSADTECMDQSCKTFGSTLKLGIGVLKLYAAFKQQHLTIAVVAGD